MDFIEDHLLPAMAVIFCTLISLLMVCIIVSIIGTLLGWESTQDKAYRHCIEDGLKDYECYAMTHGRRE